MSELSIGGKRGGEVVSVPDDATILVYTTSASVYPYTVTLTSGKKYCFTVYGANSGEGLYLRAESGYIVDGTVTVQKSRYYDSTWSTPFTYAISGDTLTINFHAPYSSWYYISLFAI